MLIFLHVLAVLVRLFGNDEHFIFVGIMFVMLMLALELEREFIRQRQKEGIAAAKARGVQFGRRPMERGEKFEKLRELWLREEISARSAAERLGVTHKTFLKWVRKDLGEK